MRGLHGVRVFRPTTNVGQEYGKRHRVARKELKLGGEEEVYGDSAYASQQGLIESKAPKTKDRTNQRVVGSGVVAELERIVNRIKSKVRSRVEHVFAVVKRQFGFAKVRYRGLAKNATRAFVVLGLANIYLARGRLGG
jgi:IS5 family transposase